MNLKIVGVLAICFTMGIVFLYVVNDWYNTNFDVEKQRLNWYSEVVETPNKVFLIGNSRVYVVDELHISHHLFQSGKNITVYDLAIGAKMLNYWQNHLDEIVFSNPEMVIVGIDPQDFIVPKKEIERNPYWFLEVNTFLAKGITSIGENSHPSDFWRFDTNNFKNPKLSSLKIIQFLETGVSEKNFNLIPTQPFDSGSEKLYYIIDLDRLDKLTEKSQIDIIPNSSEESALIEIIQTLKKNNINVILVTTPRPYPFLENWDIDEKKIWDDLLVRIEKQTQIKIYPLQNQLSDLNIFADNSHVTRLPEGKIYAEELAKIILLELDN